MVPSLRSQAVGTASPSTVIQLSQELPVHVESSACAMRVTIMAELKPAKNQRLGNVLLGGWTSFIDASHGEIPFQKLSHPWAARTS
jgi:hypothetical protein